MCAAKDEPLTGQSGAGTGRKFAPARHYVGITHGVPFGTSHRFRRVHYALLRVWRRFRCPRGIHAWDEVLGGGHYLSCDACDLMVWIESIETTYVSKERGR